MKAKHLSFLLLLMLALQSCALSNNLMNYTFQLMGVKAVPVTSRQILKQVAAVGDSTANKTIVFIPMIHYTKINEALEIRDYLDSLKAHDFVVLVEGIYPSPDSFQFKRPILMQDISDKIDSINTLDVYSPEFDTLRRKIRRVLHADIAFDDYKRKSKKNVIKASDSIFVNLDKLYWNDLTVGELISHYEKEYGEIILDDYDFSTPFNVKYKNKNTRGTYLEKSIQIRDFVVTERNKLIVDFIKESPFDKIVVVYGAKHAIDVINYLVNYDTEDNYDILDQTATDALIAGQGL